MKEHGVKGAVDSKRAIAETEGEYERDRLPRRRGLSWRLVVLVALLTLFVSSTCYMTKMPGTTHSGPLPALGGEARALSANLERHVRKLAQEIGERNLERYDELKAAASYIDATWQAQGLQVFAQPYTVAGRQVKNLEVQLLGHTTPGELVVIGAHYDSVVGTPGANDNGSGVAALLELSRIFAGRQGKLDRTLRFVAFVNEEPPYFQTERMGSLVYARRCKSRKEAVVAMLALETMGYYSDEPGSQHYPFPFSLFYPDTGNFIAVVGNLSSSSLVRRVVRTFRQRADFPSEGAAIPSWITGAGWSDHWSFWQAGYEGVMITDTALFRYRHYHEPDDTPEKVDYPRLARVVSGLVHVIEELAGGG